MTTLSSPSSASPVASPSPGPGCLSIAALIAMLLWAGAVLWGSQLPIVTLMLLNDVTGGVPYSPIQDPLANVIGALLIGLPALLGASRSRWPRFRAVYALLAWAALIMGLLSLPRFLGMGASLPASLSRVAILVGVALAILLRSGLWRQIASGGYGPATVLGGAMAIPWVLWGALGAPLDTLLGVVEGMALGLLVGALTELIEQRLSAQGNRPGWDILLGGFAVATLLAILGWALPLPGYRLVAALGLPFLGWAAYALAQRGGWPAPALLIAIATGALFAFFDPDEFSLILLGANELPTVVLRAAIAMAGVGLLGSVVLWASYRWRPDLPAVVGLTPIPAMALLLGSLMGGAGQPGFYGDHIFVVMADQADLNSLPLATLDPAARRAAVFEALRSHASTSQADLRAFLEGRGVSYQPFYLMNAIEVHTADPLLRQQLSARADVDRILDSPRLRPLPEAAPPERGTSDEPDTPPWGIRNIRADEVWDELEVRGAGIIIGQSDSGVDGSHPALREQYVGAASGDDYAWFDPWNGTTSPVDAGSHGTHTLGTVLGRGGIGVAPDAAWIGCANLARNFGNPADYLACLQFHLAPHPQVGDPFTQGDPARGAHVLNNSWGCPPLEGCDPRTLEPAVEALRAAGVFVVASAGNDGPGCSTLSAPISLFDAAFTVGAYDSEGNLADFSSVGPVESDGSGRIKPDIAAPGVSVLSSYPGSTYEFASGTSMAGPHIAGVVALMWSANPALIGNVERTEAILRETARPLEAPPENSECGSYTAVPNNYVGYGLVDAYAAVEAALAEPTP